MRTTSPFQPDDLTELGWLLDEAYAVVPMREVHAGVTDPRVIGLRHDVDNLIQPAVSMAAWEHERGYRSTYYILHTAPYWNDKRLLRQSLEFISGWGHEIGIHNNAIAASLETGLDPRDILATATAELRGYGFNVSGTVAHGDAGCYDANGDVYFVNDMLFTECVRPDMDMPEHVTPTPLASFGLDYDANWLPRAAYLSDSGGRWSTPFEAAVASYPLLDGQLHMLVHPDWWSEAFPAVEVVA